MALVRKMRKQHIGNITHASRRVCGSGKNGILKLEEGTTVCLRYMLYGNRGVIGKL